MGGHRARFGAAGASGFLPKAAYVKLKAIGLRQTGGCASYGHWIEPGGYDNSVGYYEMPGTRIVYRQAAGGIHSFGIALMISWRGEWWLLEVW